MKKMNCLDVFVSSPSDVNREWVEKSIGEWNTNNSIEKRVLLNPILWESGLPATSLSIPQPLINQELLSNSDILIAIFWTKAGSPTKSYMSGTVEEIERFLDADKPVILYFYDQAVAPSQIDPKELEKIKELKAKYKQMLTYGTAKTEKELHDFLKRDLTFNIDAVIKGKSIKFKKTVISDLSDDRNTWWKISISEQISDFLKTNTVPYVYKREITFQENSDLVVSQLASHTESSLREIMKKAREHAFDLKYGKFNYKDDLRIVYQRKWFIPILEILDKIPPANKKRVIGVGANNGDELAEIFKDNPIYEIEVLDLSQQAIEKGKNLHRSFKFHVGDMEACALKHQDYDIYLNLRSIHSSGVELKSALIECYRILKPGGFAIFSISNGYFAKPDSGEKIILGGMYDTRSRDYSTEKPYYLAEKIRKKLGDYEFENTGIRTFSTEIFVYGQKPPALRAF